MHFERRNAFQNALNYIFYQEKIIIKKNYVCLPYLKLSDLLPETYLFFYLALPVCLLYLPTRKDHLPG